MIFVAGLPFQVQDSPYQGSELLAGLMEHPALVSASLSFRDVPEKLCSYESSCMDGFSQGKHVYLFQREYATVDPRLVEFIGTDEATTCVGLVIRNRENGMTSVAHMDSPDIVEGGLSQMLLEIVDPAFDAELDVHLIGGFEDTPAKQIKSSTRYERHAKPDGYSFPLCAKIVEALAKSQEKFQIQTLFVLGHNTSRDSEGNTRPTFEGFLVETSTGSVVPARFDNATRCPDELVRRIRVSASFEDPNWKGKLLETYNRQRNQFVIAPCKWTRHLVQIASALHKLPDSEALPICSTSPDAEGPDFLDNQRRMWDYLIRHPNWKETFQMGKPRLFKRNDDEGGWVMVED
ncbi:hypothetical protein Dimus_023394 [Dionaea muscipula]